MTRSHRAHPSRRGAVLATAIATAVSTAVLGLATMTDTAYATSPDVVLVEVYGGGGNSGAILKQDFIELYNTGSSPVDLSTWSVQYASASGSTWQVTQLAGTIQPGASFLVAEAKGAGGTVELPTPDVTGTIPMSGTGAKVALVTSQTALTCGAVCHADPAVRDYVGWGSAGDYEGGSAAPATTNPTSVTRDAAGTDTDENGADFSLLEPPMPTNSAGETPVYGEPEPCGGATPVDATISAIQGTGHVTPYDGTCVRTSGVVTATKFDGYWVQDVAGDGDDTSSDGIYVFTTSSGEQPTVGDEVTIIGFADEYRAATAALALTEIVDSEFEVTGTGAPLPEPVLLGPGGREAPAQTIDDDSASRIDVETAGTFDPAGDAIDFYESLEGMLVALESPEVVGPTNGFGELPLVPAGTDDARRSKAGGVVYGAYETPNAMRVIADDEIIYQQMPAATTGNRLDGTVSGPLWYSFNNFKLQLTAVPTVVGDGFDREHTKRAKKRQLAVASFNVENLSPQDDPAKFEALAEIVVDRLRSPDIVTLEEVQDNTGPTDDGTVAANVTLDLLVGAIEAAGGPTYAYAQIDPEDKQDGGQPGGNIRVAFLYDTSRGLSFAQRGAGDATTPTEVLDEGGVPALSLSPGRVDPLNPAWDDTRKPLAGEFEFRGEKVFVVVNHFSSKGGDEPLFGRWQPPTRSSESARHAQAASVHAFVDEILSVDPTANVVVTGDLNDFEFSETLDIVSGGGVTLADLVTYLKPKQRWTYVFDGNSQVLDHILVGGGLHPDATGSKVKPRKHYDVVHVNADFPDQTSDHDPEVVRLRIG